MWQFPALEVTRNAASDLTRYVRKHFNIKVTGNLTPLETARHTVTYRDICLVPFAIRVARLPRIEGTRTLRLGRFGILPISNATRKIADAALVFAISESHTG